MLFLFLLLDWCVSFLIFLVMSGRPKRDMSSLASGNKLQPSVLHNITGPYIIVMCGSVVSIVSISQQYFICRV